MADLPAPVVSNEVISDEDVNRFVFALIELLGGIEGPADLIVGAAPTTVTVLRLPQAVPDPNDNDRGLIGNLNARSLDWERVEKRVPRQHDPPPSALEGDRWYRTSS